MRSERSQNCLSSIIQGRKSRKAALLMLASVPVVGMLSQRALAANGTDTWVGNTSVNWGDTNWIGANTIPISGDSLDFSAAGTSGLTLTDNLMTPATFNIAGITFDASAVNFIINPATAGTNGFTLTGNIIDNSTSATSVETINDAIVLNSATPTVNIVTAGSIVSFGGVLSGTNGLTLSGAGTMTLTGANTFTGGLNITGGIVAGTPQAAIPSANVISLSTGGQFYANTNHAYANNFTINTGILRAGGATTNTFSGAFNLTGPATINTDGGATSVLSGAISGAGALTVTTNGATGTGTSTLTGANTFGGGVTILGSATAASTSTTTLNINGDAALGAVPAVPTTNLTFAASPGITTTIGSLVGSAGLVNLNANRNILVSSGIVNFDPGQGNMMVISGNITDNTTSITKTSDSGILVWNGVNTFASGTTFTFSGTNPSDDGILRLGNSGALGTLPMTINLNEGNQSPSAVELVGGIVVGNGAGGPGTFAGDVITSVGRQAGDSNLRNLSGNNTYAGILAVSNSGGQMTIESADPNSTLTLSGNISTGAATTTITNRTILLYGSGNGLISGTITNVAPANLGVTVTNTAGTVGTVVVGGAAGSTWTFTGANTYTGTSTTPVLNLAGGTAVVNYSLGGSFASTTNLTLAGGNLTMIGSASGTSQSYAGTLIVGGVGATTAVAGAGVTGGGSNVLINPNGGTTTLTLPNAWTRSAGGTVNFDLSTAGGTSSVVLAAPGTAISGTGVLVNGIFGYGTVKDSSGVIGFATNNSGSIGRFTGATTALTAVPATTATSNATTSGVLAISPAASFAVNSLAIDASGGGSLDLGGPTDVMTVTSGGLLMTNATSAGDFTISDGQVGLAAKELIVQQFGTGTLTINGTISSGAGSLTKSGPGTLVLGGANAYTGVTTINTGVLSVSADNNLGSTTGTIAPIIFNGGTLAVTTGFTMSGRSITLDPAGGTFDIAPSQTLTIGSVIASPGLAVNGGTGLSAGPLIKTDSGTLTLTGTANTYTGGTFLNAGTINIAADGSLGQTPGSLQAPGVPDINVVFKGNSTLQAGAAAVSLQFNRSVLINSGVIATLDPQANTLSVAGAITSQSGSGSLAIGAGNAAGTVALTSAVSSYTIPTTVNSGTLSVSFLNNEGAAGGNPSSIGASSNAASNLVLATGTTLNYTGGSTTTDRNFTIATGAASSGSVSIGVSNAATRLAMSGAPVGTGTGAGSIGLTKIGAGTLAFTNTENYTGPTNLNAGTLLVNGSLTSSALTMLANTTIGGTGTINTLTVPSSGTLAPGDPATNSGVGTLNASALTLSSGSVLKFEFGTGTNDLVNVTNSGGLNILGGQLNILNAGAATAFGTPGTYNLFSYVGTLAGSVSNFTFGTTSSLDSYVVNNNTSLHEVQLVISLATSATWNVNGGGLWDSSASNWSPAGVPNNAGEVVIFGPVVTGGAATISLDGNKTAGGIVFNNSTSSYTIDNIGGTGTGTLTLDNGAASTSISVSGAPAGLGHTISAPIQLNSNLNLSNTVAGTTLTLSGGVTGSGKSVSITSGTVQIGAGGTTGSLATGPVTMSNGTNLIFNTIGGPNLTLPVLAGTGGTLIQNGNNTLTLAAGGGNTVGGLQANNGTVNLNGNNLSLNNFSGTGANAVITDNSAAVASPTVFTYAGSASSTFAGSINDGSSGQKVTAVLGLTGGGSLTLTNTSNYSGGTTINQGNINVQANNALGAATGTITMNALSAPTRLEIGNGATIPNPIVVNAANAVATFGVFQASDTTTTTFTGPITFNAAPTAGGEFVGPASGGFMILAGPVFTTGTIPNLLVRQGNVEFADSTGTSSYPVLGVTGPGTVILGHANAVATNTIIEPGLNNTAGVFDLHGFNQTVSGITQPTVSLATIESTTGPSVLTVNTPSTTAVAPFINFPDSAPDIYSGVLTDTLSLSTALSLVKTGPGTLLLTNASTTTNTNSYTGGTTITQGVLGAVLLSSSGGLTGTLGISGGDGTGNDVIFNGGILRYTGATATTDQTFTINPGITGELDVSTAATALTLTNAGNGQSISGPTSAGFIKGGPGTLTIDTPVVTTYAGNTTLSGGTLIVNGSLGTAGTGSTLTLAAGTTLTTTAGLTSGTIAGSLDHTATSGSISIPAANTALHFADSLKLDGGAIAYNVNSPSVTTGLNTTSQGLITAGGLTVGAGSPETISLTFSNTNGLPSTFSLNLFDYTGTALPGSISNMAFVSNLGRATFTADSLTSGQLNVDVVNGGAANLFWNAITATSAPWDTFVSNANPGTANWYNAGTNNPADTFHSGDNVTFANSGAAAGSGHLNAGLQTNVTLASTVTPGSVADTASSATTYTFSGAGAIAGGTAGTPFLTVSGGGTLVLETANTYAGDTVITNNSTLNVGGGTAVGSIGTSAVSIAAGSQLLYTVAAASTLSSTITGAGNLNFAVTSNNEAVQAGDLSGFTGTLNVQSGIVRPANATNPLNPTNTVGANVVQNGGELYWDTGSNHAPTTPFQITINGTGTTPTTGANAGVTGANNDGAIRVGSATLTTLPGVITVASNSLIGLDGGATLSLTNANPLAGSNVTLSLTGGGTLSIGGNVALGPTFTLAAGTSPVTLAPPVSSNINVTSPITGSGVITINSSTTPTASTPSTAGTVTLGSNPGYTGGFTINTADLLISSATALGTNAGGTLINGTGALGVVTGTLQLATTGTSGSPVTIPGAFTLGGHGTATDTAAMITQAHIENISGVNVLSGNITPTTGGDYYDIQSDAGTLTLAGNFVPGTIGAGTTPTTIVYPGAPAGALRVLQLQGAGNGNWNGAILNGSTAVIALSVGNPNLNPTGSGTWTLAGVNTYTGPTNVFVGTLTLADTGTIATSSTNALTVAAGASANINGVLSGSPQVVANGPIVVGPADANNFPTFNSPAAPFARTWTSLNLASGGSVALPPQTAVPYNDRTVLVINGLGSASGLTFGGGTGAWQGELDLGGNDMVVKNAGAAGLAAITNQIQQGRNGGGAGLWLGTAGITSSSAAAHVASAAPTALGVVLNHQGAGNFYSSFDGQTVGANDVLVKYTYAGDANLDGVINGDDYSLIDNGFNTGLSGWQNGDFNYDSSINAADYSIIDNAFVMQSGTSNLSVSAGPAEMIATNTDQIAGPSASSVPEPGALSLLGIGAAGLLRRRRRRA